MEEEIIRKSTEIYIKYGIRSVSMDDIARELGISKKTIYQYFKDKDDLVEKVVTGYIHTMECKMMNCTSPGLNSIDQLLEISKFLISNHTKINNSVMYDLQKYHPKAWEIITNFRSCHTYDNILENMKNGVEQGLYRDDIKMDIIARLYVYRMEQSYDIMTNIIANYSFEDIFNTLFIYHIRGIANAKGLAYLEKKIKNENLN